jgi:hypothetical protein
MRVIEPPLWLKNSFLQLSGPSAPDVAPAGTARIWYDAANNQIKFSVNGGSFGAVLGSLRLRDLTEQILVASPAASAAAALMLFDNAATPFSGSASGTFFGINAVTGFAGNLLDLQINAVSQLKVDNVGRLFANAAQTGSRLIVGATGTLANNAAYVNTGATTTLGLVVRGVASQTASLFEVQDSAGNYFLRVLPLSAGAYTISIETAGSLSKIREQTVAVGGTDRLLILPNGSQCDILNAAGAQFMASFSSSGHNFYSSGTLKYTFGATALTLADAVNIAVNTTTGTKIGTVGGAAGQKLGFFNATPIVQPLLATGAGATVDNVITALQNLGLVRQS